MSKTNPESTAPTPKPRRRQSIPTGKNDILNTPIKQNRYWNFRQIVLLHGPNEVARMMGKTNTQIGHYGGPNPNRAVGRSMVQQIETVFSLPPGALDVEPPPETKVKDALLGEIAATLTNATPDDKALVLEIVKVIISRTQRIFGPGEIDK